MLRRVAAVCVLGALGALACDEMTFVVNDGFCCPAGVDTASGCADLGGRRTETNTCSPTCISGPCSSFVTGLRDEFGCPIVTVVQSKCAPDASAVDVQVHDVQDEKTSTCTPQLSEFAPGPFTPPNAPSDACTSSQLQQMYDACFGPGNDATQCQTFKTANATCAGCVETPSTAPSWGALVDTPEFGTLNTAGCVALLTGDFTTTGCAARLEASFECGAAACIQCLTDGSGGGGFHACIQASGTSVCSAYGSAECPADAGAVATCTVFPDFETGFLRLATTFCSAE